MLRTSGTYWARRTIIKAVPVVLLAALCLPALAAEPAWWTQQKADCHLSPSLDYATFQAQGYPCNRGGSVQAPGGDPAVQIGTAVGNALVQSFKNAAAERQQRLDQMALENSIAQRKEADRQAAQDRNDKRQAELAAAHLQGVLKFSDPDADLPPAAAAHAGTAAGQSAQTNPGANTPEARAMVKSETAAALISGSAKEQLHNATGGGQTLGQTFDNGRSPGDATLTAQRNPIAPPASAAAPVDPRLASDKNYQAAMSTLTQTKATADALNKRQTDLQALQDSNPTPQRQIELYKLSGDLHEANGAYQQATNNVAAVKKTILGPAVIVEDAPSGAAPNAAPTTSSAAPASAMP